MCGFDAVLRVRKIMIRMIQMKFTDPDQQERWDQDDSKRRNYYICDEEIRYRAKYSKEWLTSQIIYSSWQNFMIFQYDEDKHTDTQTIKGKEKWDVHDDQVKGVPDMRFKKWSSSKMTFRTIRNQEKYIIPAMSTWIQIKAESKTSKSRHMSSSIKIILIISGLLEK